MVLLALITRIKSEIDKHFCLRLIRLTMNGRFLVTFILKRDSDNGPNRPGMTDEVDILINPV